MLVDLGVDFAVNKSQCSFVQQCMHLVPLTSGNKLVVKKKKTQPEVT